jgi:hypothetical protein
MQHLEGSGIPVLYIGCTVLKGLSKRTSYVVEVSRKYKKENGISK